MPWAPAATIVEEGHAVINTNGDYYYVLGKRDKFDGDKPAASTDTFRNYTFMGTTFDEDESLVIGSMFCIWCDYPAAESEKEIATNVRQALRVMGGQMDKKNGAVPPPPPSATRRCPAASTPTGPFMQSGYTYKLGELTHGRPYRERRRQTDPHLERTAHHSHGRRRRPGPLPP